MKYKDYYAILGSSGAPARTRSRPPIASSRANIIRTCRRKRTRRRSSRRWRKPTKRSRIPKSARPTTSSAPTGPARTSARRPIGASNSRRGKAAFEDIDLADLFAGLAGRQGRGGAPPCAIGRWPAATTRPSCASPSSRRSTARKIDLELSALEWDPDGGVRRVPHRVRTRIPRGVTNGEKLRVPGKGGKGIERRARRRPLSRHRSRRPSAVSRPARTSTSICRWRHGRRCSARASSCPRPPARSRSRCPRARARGSSCACRAAA